MTTLLDEGEARVVRCDTCRRLWPVKPEWLDRSGWVVDEDRDLHTCPICVTEPLDAPARQIG
jgi:hypothetical protein